jgi:hypothetical protein
MEVKGRELSLNCFQHLSGTVRNSTFSILDGMLGSEDIWYVRNSNYDTAMGLKIIAYNMMVISSIELGEMPRAMSKIAVC